MPEPAQSPLPAAPEPIAIGSLIAGRYRVVGRVAEGGMGVVYEAIQEGIGRRVAIKVPRAELVDDPVARTRLAREAAALSKLHHPNTVTIVDYRGDVEVPYLAMEYVEGEPLSELLARRGSLPFATATRIAIEVARALAEAHSKGVIHRDLKPENVFVIETVDGGAPFVKVIDFGIAQIDSETERLTRQGYVCGTPTYMSPQQARGEEIDGRGDLYALGVMLWEMLGGHLPFEGQTPLHTAIKHQRDPIPRLGDGVPEPVQRSVYRAMAKRVDERPQNAETLSRQLAEALREANELPSAAPRHPRGQGRRLARLFLALGGLALATGVLGLL